MTKLVTIIDYGVGNLYSVRRAVEVSGGEDIRVSDRIEDIMEADKIILPGVGAFEDGMKGLRERGLVEPLTKVAREGKQILGICLGMQLMASTSEEFGVHEGLSLIPGKVQAIPKTSVDGKPLKVPFIGWSTLISNQSEAEQHGSLADLHQKSVYLVHSFQFSPSNSKHLLASYEYGGHQINAAVRSGNVLGVQFHPEKSGSVGLSIIRNFIR